MEEFSFGAGRARRRAFFIWAAILSLAFGVLFTGTTALTIGLWLAHQNALTTPVSDLSFFALGCAGYLAHPFVKWMVLFFFSSPISSSSYSQMKGCKSISRIYKLLRKPSSSSA